MTDPTVTSSPAPGSPREATEAEATTTAATRTPDDSGWRTMALVARREVRERLRSKVFALSTLLSLVVLVGIVVAAGAASQDRGTTYDLGVVGERPAAVADAVESLVAGSDELDEVVDVAVESYPDTAAAERAVLDGDVDVALHGSTLVVERDIDQRLAALVEAANRQVAIADALADAGASPADISAASAPRTLELHELDPTGPGDERAQIALVGTIVLYAQLIGFGYWVASGIVEEKASRVVELLLAKTSARRLLAGKIAGIGLLGFTQIVVFVGVALGLAVAMGQIDLPTGTGRMGVEIVAWFVLGYALYSCLFAVGGAIASRTEELQGTTFPITLLAMAAFIAAMFTGDDPTGPVARVATFVPPAAPLVMPVRSAAGALPLWEAMVGIGLVLATIAVVVPLAARIYTGGALFTRGQLELRAAFARADD